MKIDNALANAAEEFCENLNLVGDFYGQPFKLRKWQRLIVRHLFGRIGKDKQRVVRKCLMMLPRKVGKTYLAAVVCLYALLCYGENQVVLCAAASQDQASRVFETMWSIIRQDATLFAMLGKAGKRITYDDQNSYFVAVTSSGESAHGHNPTVVVLDELHAWGKPNHRKLFDALTSGRGARKAPITIMLTTQSDNPHSIAGEEFNYARQLKGRIENGEIKTDGEFENPGYLAVLYFADPDRDDWHDEKTWFRVAPALGDFLSIEEYRQQYKEALSIPSRQRSFKTLYLNMPATEVGRWMDMEAWKKCKGEIDYDKLKQVTGYAALDLAPVNDLSSLSIVFPLDGKFYVLQRFWCDDESIVTRTADEKVPYDQWKKDGWIVPTGGNSTDFEHIRNDIAELNQQYRIQMLVADKAFAYELGSWLANQHGMKVEWFSQSFKDMGPPTARTEKLVIEQTLVHPGNPVLDYCVRNVRCETDAAGNYRPSNRLKLRTEKTDGAQSLIMAVGAYMLENAEDRGESIYETQGVMVV